MAESDIVRNEQLLKLIDEFREKVRSGMRDSENFMTLSKIERLWSELKHGFSWLISILNNHE